MPAIQRAPICSDRRVERVLGAITQDLTSRPSRAAAAKIANLEPAYFSKRFRRVVGVTFAVWNAQIRVEGAKPLLAILDLPITQVAAAVAPKSAPRSVKDYHARTLLHYY